MNSKTSNPQQYQYSKIIQYAMAPNTIRAYSACWANFDSWCRKNRYRSLPAKPKAVNRYLVDQATSANTPTGKSLSIRSLELHLSAIKKMHLDHNHLSPTDHQQIRNVFKGLSRLKGRPVNQAQALREYDIKAILNSCGQRLIDQRNGALIAVGFAGALRRSEICQLQVEDINFDSDHQRMIVTIKRSKTDQLGFGHQIGIINGRQIQPVSRLRAWLDQAQITDGYLFRSMLKNGQIKERPLDGSDVSRLIKNYVVKIGLRPELYSSHSLRSGFITSAVVHRARFDKIMEVSRHKNINTVMSYVRDNNIFKNHAGTDFL